MAPTDLPTIFFLKILPHLPHIWQHWHAFRKPEFQISDFKVLCHKYAESGFTFLLRVSNQFQFFRIRWSMATLKVWNCVFVIILSTKELPHFHDRTKQDERLLLIGEGDSHLCTLIDYHIRPLSTSTVFWGYLTPPLPLCLHFQQPISTVGPQNMPIPQPPSHPCCGHKAP